jgi:hypothetical protein
LDTGDSRDFPYLFLQGEGSRCRKSAKEKILKKNTNEENEGVGNN